MAFAGAEVNRVVLKETCPSYEAISGVTAMTAIANAAYKPTNTGIT